MPKYLMIDLQLIIYCGNKINEIILDYNKFIQLCKKSRAMN